MKPNIDKENNKKETMLFQTCNKGNINLIKILIEHGANVNKKK